MRQAYAHSVTVAIDPGGDERAPGGAITVALCGRWDHEPPCPLAPHHIAISHDGGELTVRVLFVADPENEHEVRTRLDAALATGVLDGPDGITRWTLRASGPATVRDAEREHAARLIDSR